MEIYIIQPGDTLYGISLRSGIPLQEIINLNQFPDPNQLVIGQAILLPTPPVEPLRYTVAPGDTLFELARFFGTTVNALVQANNISNPGYIRTGTVLVIPGWSQISFTVRRGDSLYFIANQYNVPVNLIARVNHLAAPTLIYPGQTLIVPRNVPAITKKSIETMGYFQPTNLTGLDRSLSQISAYITYANIFQFPVKPDGSITDSANTQRVVDLFKKYRIRPFPVVTNWGPSGFDPDLARTIIGDEAVKTQTINNLLTFLQKYGFTGVNIDFENMYPEDRRLYTGFIRDMAAAMKTNGYLTSLAVPPKFSDLPSQPWVGTFDYAALGQLVDIIFLMTYEWGWIGGPPSAISPINLVRRALTYATSLIPPSKIIQGVPFYGYDWELPQTPGKPAVPVNLVEVYDIAYRFGSVIQYDPAAQAPWFRYVNTQGVEHEVWFEDARSVRAKYETTLDFNLRGAGWWSYINQPYGFPQNWPIMSELFNVLRI